MPENATKKGMTRRGFIMGAAAGAGAAVLPGLSPREAKAVPLIAVPRKWDYETDVLVVGGGGAGIAAAWEAIHAKAQVLLLEKGTVYGGRVLYVLETLPW